MKSNLSHGILYLSLYHSLSRVHGKNRIILTKTFFAKIGRQYLVPKPLRYLVLKEMESMNLIEIIDRNSLKIMDCNIDIEKDVNKLFQLAGIYG